VRCRTCKAESEAAANRLLCGSCNDWHVDVIAGEEMLLQRVEIETAEDPVH
jgi:hydrogenase nickel incorporation protein HypA/HybF